MDAISQGRWKIFTCKHTQINKHTTKQKFNMIKIYMCILVKDPAGLELIVFENTSIVKYTDCLSYYFDYNYYYYSWIELLNYFQIISLRIKIEIEKKIKKCLNYSFVLNRNIRSEKGEGGVALEIVEICKENHINWHGIEFLLGWARSFGRFFTKRLYVIAKRWRVIF